MALFLAIFLCGLLLGAALAAMIAFFAFKKHKQEFFDALHALEGDKKLLSEAVSKGHENIRELSETAAMANFLKAELDTTRQLLEQKRNENSLLSERSASLLIEKETSSEFLNQRIKDLSTIHENMKEAFASVSKDTLLKNVDLLNTSFKQSMEHFFRANESERRQSQEQLSNIMKPLRESLGMFDKKVSELETTRQGAYAGIKEQIEGLKSSQVELQRETHHLARALSAPTIRGRWGEMQLRRVVELSGLSAHCDFVEQKTLKVGDESLRPDMIVTLPQNKKIVIDAKAPLETIAEITGSSLEKDEQKGIELAASLKRHLISLKKKAYHTVIGESPEFVVLFLPSEAFLHWALIGDPMLLDFAAQNEIVIATPVTLIALLKAIAFGFRQEAIASNIEEVRILSQELIDRVEKMSSHFEKLGKSLKIATESYNQTLASLDSRVLVTARKLREIRSFDNNSMELKKIPPTVDVMPREVNKL